MTVSRQADPRANQKQRTRNAILDAAADLLRDGTMPTVATAAQNAKVARATAYRYFPTQAALGEAIAAADPMLATVDRAVEQLTSEDPEQRLLELLDAYNPIVIADEPHMRTVLAILQQNWVKTQHENPDNPPYARSNTRLRWLDEALAPATHLPEQTRQRLRAALALTLGIESIIVMKDVCELEDEDALAVLRWAATTLLRAALQPQQPQP